MLCSKCGNETDDEAMICPKCGCALVSGSAEKPNRKRSVLALGGFIIGAVVTIITVIYCIVHRQIFEYFEYWDWRNEYLITTPLSISIFMTVYFGRAAFEK